MLHEISCISTCACCLLSFHQAPLKGRLYPLFSMFIRPPQPKSPFSEAQLSPLAQFPSYHRASTASTPWWVLPAMAVCFLIVEGTGQGTAPGAVCPQKGVSLLVTPLLTHPRMLLADTWAFLHFPPGQDGGGWAALPLGWDGAEKKQSLCFLPGQSLELDQGRCLRGEQQKLLGV